MEVAEKLVRMFPTVRTATVVDVVAHCVDQFPDDDPLFIERAAKACLSEHQADVLSVSLDDRELRAEMELSTRLIIAASESTTHLDEAEIDALLGL